MGNGDEGKSIKPEKQASPAALAADQTNAHVYPDWAAMQAYYGPRVAVPPYFNSAVASGHSPHPYMWGPPQPMMPPYGAPYAAIYAHGGVYAHPGVPFGTHSQGHGVPLSPAVGEAMVATPLSMDPPAKSPGNADRGLIKKLKEFDGLAISIGNNNNNTDSAEGDADHGFSQSEETDGSSDGSDENTTGAAKNGKKRSREGTPNAGGDVKNEKRISRVPGGDASEKAIVPVMEVRNPSSPNCVQQPSPMIPNQAWLHNEKELKRERRKQSNRESARRSRLRKQAEAEELGRKVEALCTENLTLKTEINHFKENSEKLKLENMTLMEKLKKVQRQPNESTLNKRGPPGGTEDLLARIENSGGSVERNDEEGEVYEKNSGGKLRQLFAASPRTDAVAAG